MERVLPLVDYVEITPDSLADFREEQPEMHNEAIRELQSIASDARLILHGVGLSIGTYAGYSEPYLHLVDQVMTGVDVTWHSEHLGYVNVDGRHLGTMLALPRTEQVLDMICERVSQIQARYGVPFLLENIVHVLPDYGGDYSDAGFLNALTKRTGCGLILDVYNLECDAHNHGFNIPQFLAELDLTAVREIHLAGGAIHRGFKLDVHSRLTQDSTIALAREVLAAGRHVETVTYELLPEAVPKLGYDAIATELQRLRKELLN